MNNWAVKELIKRAKFAVIDEYYRENNIHLTDKEYNEQYIDREREIGLVLYESDVHLIIWEDGSVYEYSDDEVVLIELRECEYDIL